MFICFHYYNILNLLLEKNILWDLIWNLPNSVGIAGPQRLDKLSENILDKISDKMPEDLPISNYINLMMKITRNKIFVNYIIFLLKKNYKDIT